MKKLIAVIGSSFGDEGKGLMVDYFADQVKTGYVVRFNSSAQAGHSVQLDDGTRHIFSHFGSGTLAGLSTVLAEEFVVSPYLFQREHKELLAKGYTPKVYVHQLCRITTPYDMIVNQMLEYFRGEQRHGSCGVGFGETIERHEKYPALSTRVEMFNNGLLGWSEFVTKLDHIRSEWVRTRVPSEFYDMADPTFRGLVDAYNSPQMINDYLKSWEYFLENVEIIPNYEILNNDNVIFEGAQGLLLDMDHDNFPYVTRSNTGIKNVLEIVKQLDEPKTLEVTYVSRCYTTRHGAGPLPHEQDFPDHLKDLDKTNIPNPFQGTLRYAPLDMGIFYETTTRDLEQMVKVDFRVFSSTAFTCVDQGVTEFILNGKTVTVDSPDELGDFLLKTCANYVSFGPTRSTIRTNELTPEEIVNYNQQ